MAGVEGEGVSTKPTGDENFRPLEWYREHLLDAFEALGPRVDTRTVQKWLIERLRPLLTAEDFEKINKGHSERWWQYVNGNRNYLKNEGLVFPTRRNTTVGYGSPQGVWEMTEKGKEFIEARKAGRKSGG